MTTGPRIEGAQTQIGFVRWADRPIQNPDLQNPSTRKDLPEPLKVGAALALSASALVGLGVIIATKRARDLVQVLRDKAVANLDKPIIPSPGMKQIYKA